MAAMVGRRLCLALLGALLVACSRTDDETGTAGASASRDAATAEPRARAAADGGSAAGAASEAAAAKARHTLNGTVKTYDGRALPGAVVRAEPVPVFPHAPETRTPSEVTADAAGAFALTSLEAGDWALLVSAEGALGTYAATVRVPERARFDIVLPRGSVIEGTVIDETTRAPVVGARVRLSGARRFIGDTRTAADGRFRMALFGEASRFRIDAAGYATELAGDSRADVEYAVVGRHEVTLVAQHGHTLTGRVVGPDGPIAGARVKLEPGGGADDPADVREATTDTAGRYEFEHLVDSRSYWIHAEAAGWVTKDEPDPDVAGPEPPTGERVEPSADGWTAPDIEMRRRVPIGRCTIRGRVVDEEEHAVGGVELVTHHRVGAVRATSHDDGSFVLADVATDPAFGQVAIECAPGSAWEGEATAYTHGGDDVRDVAVCVERVERPHVRGRVLGPDKSPVAGARVVVVPFRREARTCLLSDDPLSGVEARTTPDGAFDVTFERDDLVAVVVEAPDLARWTADFTTSELPESIEVLIGPRRSVSGRVVRAGTDEGVAGLDVAMVRGSVPHHYQDEPDFLARFRDRTVTTTAADGSFRVETHPNDVAIGVSGAGWMTVQEFFDDSSTDDLRIEVVPALQIIGRAEFTDGRPCSGVVVAIHEVDPEDVGTESESHGIGDPADARRIRATPDGSFACDQLVPGRWWLEFSGGTPQVIRLVAGPVDAGTRDLRVELVRGVTIRGRCVGPDGRPVEGVAVVARADGRNGTGGAAKSDRTGAFAIGGLDGGPHVVDATADGFFDWKRSGVRADGDPVEIRLDPGLAVAGVLRDSAGETLYLVDLVVEPVEAVATAKEHRVQTDVEGRFRVSALTPGRWRVRFAEERRAEHFDPVVVEAGSEALELRTVPRPPPPDDDR